MASGCVELECTVAETGICLLNNEPSSCPERVGAEDTKSDTPAGVSSKAAFPASQACTLAAARGLMTERYIHLVGILGEPNAGKTGCLVSLYLSAGQRCLGDFSFVDSRTLMGFEEISQGTRQWNKGRIPEQFTDHTLLPDNRTAGFLHIGLARAQQDHRIDLLCSDLPGEWTTELIERNRVDRLEFLKRADAIWLVVDGTELVAPDKRQLCVQRTKLVIERLGDFLGDGRRLILVITRRDQKAPDERVVQDICTKGAQRGFETKWVAVASFSDNGKVAAGTGIPDLIEHTTVFNRVGGEVWQQDGSETSFESPKIGLVRRGTA